MFRNVIVGIDGKDGGQDALALANVLLGASGRLTPVNGSKESAGRRKSWRTTAPRKTCSSSATATTGDLRSLSPRCRTDQIHPRCTHRITTL
jgi:hypothetical protein